MVCTLYSVCTYAYRVQSTNHTNLRIEFFLNKLVWASFAKLAKRDLIILRQNLSIPAIVNFFTLLLKVENFKSSNLRLWSRTNLYYHIQHFKALQTRYSKSTSNVFILCESSQALSCSCCIAKMTSDFVENMRNGILLSKLFWPTVRKKSSGVREKLLKFEAEC